MWQRFTERARRVVFFARDEAERLGENSVGTEHLLLGLVRESDGVAARILDRLGVSRESIRLAVDQHVPHGQEAPGQDYMLTPQAKRMIDLAYEEARRLDNDYIGTEHLLLGLLREEEGLSAKILTGLGADLECIRRQTEAIQSEPPNS
jgi:ATP-dependent Clp protease ATP-binding subunit ClpC